MSTVCTSRDRILNTLAGKPVDRTAIMPFDVFEVQKLIDGADDLVSAAGELLDDFTNGWKRKDPRYREAVQFAVERGCDIIHRTSFIELDRRFFLVPDEFISVKDSKINKEILQREYTVKTPQGNLYNIEELKKNISTTWIKKPLIEDLGDVEKILSVSYHFQQSDLKMFFKERDELGDRGLICCFVSNPLVCVSHLFHFDKFLLWTIAERKTIEKLMETVYERIYTQLEYLLDNGVGPLIEFGGSEQATPPMMSPELYDEFVVKYDSRLIDLVHRHGQYVRVHCHGKIRTVLDKLIKMGVDMLNPVESPPSGDIELQEVVQKVNGRMVLEGNIQFSDLEFGNEAEIEILVKKAIKEGSQGKFVLEPTEWPITFLTESQKRNYLRFIESGLE